MLVSGLASGQRNVGTPWGALAKNLYKFIPAMYLPPGINFRDPRNMSGPEIQRLFDFWRNRQAEHGPEQTLRWSFYINGRRESVRVEYGRRADQEKADKGVVGKRKRRAREQKSAVNVPAPDFDNMLRMSASPPEISHALNQELSDSHALENDRSEQTQSGHAGMVLAGIDTDVLGRQIPPRNTPPGQAERSESAPPDGQQDMPSHSAQSMYRSFTVVDGIEVPSGFTLVDDKILELFHLRGMPTPVATNGPGHGLPRYLVSISDLQSLRIDVEEEASQREESQPVAHMGEGSDQSVDDDLPRSRPVRKRKATEPAATASRTQKKARHINRNVEAAVKTTGNRALRSQTAGAMNDGVRTRSSGRTPRQTAKKQ